MKEKLLNLLLNMCNARGLFLLSSNRGRGGGGALQIKVARDQENIFHFELNVNKE